MQIVQFVGYLIWKYIQVVYMYNNETVDKSLNIYFSVPVNKVNGLLSNKIIFGNSTQCKYFLCKRKPYSNIE